MGPPVQGRVLKAAPESDRIRLKSSSSDATDTEVCPETEVNVVSSASTTPLGLQVYPLQVFFFNKTFWSASPINNSCFLAQRLLIQGHMGVRNIFLAVVLFLCVWVIDERFLSLQRSFGFL